MAFMGIGIDSINEKVEHGLIFDASKQRATDKNATKKVNEKLDNALNKAKWKVAKATYEKERDPIITKIADKQFNSWQQWIKINRDLKKNKATPEDISSQKQAHEEKLESDINDTMNIFEFTALYDYINAVKILKPDLAKLVTTESEKAYVRTKADDLFKKKVEAFMKLANKLAKGMALQQLGQFDTDKINQQLSEIPLKIEEKIDSLKETLDLLLGKIVGKVYQPEFPEFDVNKLIGILKTFLDPVLATTKPLTAVVGNIPIIGDIIPLLTSASGGGSSLTKEELKKFIEQYKKPEIPSDLMTKVNKIYDDIMVFCISLPTILVNLIFAMIDVIYSKLNIITSVIPLGGMFPLSLISAAITAGPKILQLVKVMPGMVYDCILGILKDKWAECMALGMRKPQIDLGSLQAVMDDIAEQKTTKKTKTKNKEDYNDISKKIYEKYKLNDYGYSLAHIKKIQKNYKQIFNGSKEELVTFKDNGKEQNLPSQTFGFASDNSKTEYGYTKDTKTKREKPSVTQYEAYLEKIVSQYMGEVKTAEKQGKEAKIKYLKLYKTENVVGGFYDVYKDQLKWFGQQVIIEEELKPNPGFFGMGKSLNTKD